MTFRLTVLSLLVATVLQASASPSELWGKNGERWQPNGRLPDFSYAGYHRGEQPVPDVPQVSNVKDFGARGDGTTDDTAALQAAINASSNGAVFIPPGRYVVTDYLRITKPGVVLRGAGPDKSVLWFPRGLDEVHPRAGRTSTGSPASGYSFDGAFVTIQGDYRAKALAKITAAAQRGDQSVTVDDTAGLKIGQDVFVWLSEDAGQSLKTYLYCGDPGDIRRGKKLDTKQLVRITAIEGNVVRFDRPLRFETRAEWQPQIRAFDPTVREAGIENLGFAFPAAQYRGHFKENGANAIELRQVADCWVRNITIHNGDMGINVVATRNTIDGVVLSADKPRQTRDAGVDDCTGHHAIQCKGAEDNLVTHFDVRAPYVHDLSVEHASGNVLADGKGTDLDFDHHKDTPYENLYTAIDCGRGTRVWRCGGGASLGRQCAGWGTFWGISATRQVTPPPAGWGPATMNFVGLSAEVSPRNLHAAQLERRLTKKN